MKNYFILLLIVFVDCALPAKAQIITTIAGNGTLGFEGDNGPAISAELNNTAGVTVDKTGNIYFADYGNNRIRKVTLSGEITTVAGGGSSFGDGGPATLAKLYGPRDVLVDKLGIIYI